MSARNGPGGDSRGRPATNGTGPTAENLDSSHGTPNERQKHDHTRQVRGCLVLVVETPSGKYRRRTFLTLAAAERACRRAEESGHVASVMVARLEPVAVIG